MSEETTETPPILANLKQMCQMLDLSMARVKQMRTQGILIAHKHNTYDVIASVREYLRNLRARKTATGEADVHRARRAKADATKAEMDLALRQGKLIEVEYAGEAYEKLSTMIRQMVLSIADRTAPLVYDAKNLRAARKILREECEQILREASEAKPAWVEEIGTRPLGKDAA